MLLTKRVTYWSPPASMFNSHGRARELDAHIRDDGVVVSDEENIEVGGMVLIGTGTLEAYSIAMEAKRIAEIVPITNLRVLEQQSLLVLEDGDSE